MYNDYFHFSELPFSIAPDPHLMFMSIRHQEGLAHLLYGINFGGGFVALTGEVGTGKTTLCHCLLQQLPEKIDIALLLNPKLDAIELLAAMCDELGVKYDKSAYTLKNLVDALNHYLLEAHANGRRTVLVIDEAQNLSLDVLEQVRLLTNLETTKTKLLQIILVGQPELKDLLNRRELRQLNQRITARYHLLPLSLAETRSYIRHRLMVCKGDPNLFKESAVKKIYQLSKGIPRVINIICHCALLGAYSSDVKVIGPAIINRAARETLAYTSQQESRVKPLLALLALSCLGLAGLYYQNNFINAIQQNNSTASKLKPIESTPEQAGTKRILSGKFPEKAPQTPPVDVAQNNAIPVITTPVVNKKTFAEWLENPALNLNSGLINALRLWGKTPTISQPLNCDTLPSMGIKCLIKMGNWNDLIGFKRMAILEFSVSPTVKRYGILTGIKNGNPVITMDQNVTFPLADVLRYWNGYFLLLWKLPAPALKNIYPGETSANVEWLRRQLTEIDGIKQDGVSPQFFDAVLKKRVIDFQKANMLFPDGKVGMQTIFYIDNATGAKGSLRLQD